jgi:hypothetical protein
VNPRIGEKLDEFDPREVRRILVSKYEIRYEIQESTIYVLRLLAYTRGSVAIPDGSGFGFAFLYLGGYH